MELDTYPKVCRGLSTLAYTLLAISVTALTGCAGEDRKPGGGSEGSPELKTACSDVRGLALRGRHLHLHDNPKAGEFPVFQLPTESSTVNYSLGNMQLKQAVFSCQEDGSFHIVDALDPTQHIVESYLRFGMFIDLYLYSNPGLFTFSIVGQDQVACTQEYAPVCAVAPLATDDFCDADCPFGESQTYGNACTAEASGALIYKVGECGDEEGQVYVS